MNAVAKTAPVHVPTANEVLQTQGALIDTLRMSLYPGAKEESVAMVIAYCKARNLDVLQKPVHIVPMRVKVGKTPQGKPIFEMRDTIMPGITLYRIQAARTDEYVGKSEPTFGPDVTYKLDGGEVTVPEWCQITVFRMKHGKERAFPAREFWIENYATNGEWINDQNGNRQSDAPNSMWKKRSRGQLMKVAEAQALRMAFPEEVGGEPTAEEMEGKSIEAARGEVIEGVSESVAPTKPAEPAKPEWIMWGPNPDDDSEHPDVVSDRNVAQSAVQWKRWAMNIIPLLKTPEDVLRWVEQMKPVVLALDAFEDAEIKAAVASVKTAIEAQNARVTEAAKPETGGEKPAETDGGAEK